MLVVILMKFFLLAPISGWAFRIAAEPSNQDKEKICLFKNLGKKLPLNIYIIEPPVYAIFYIGIRESVLKRINVVNTIRFISWIETTQYHAA